MFDRSFIKCQSSILPICLKWKKKKERKTAITIFSNSLSTPDFFFSVTWHLQETVNFTTKYPLQNQNIVHCSVSEFCVDWVTALLIKEWILQPSRLKHWLWEKNNNEANVCSLSGIRLIERDCVLPSQTKPSCIRGQNNDPVL